MRPVDYDFVAPAYDRRYSYRAYAGTGAVLRRFVGGITAGVVVEIGCGTGHWLRELADATRLVVGLDLSWGMLTRARDASPDLPLVQGDAVNLPWATRSVDRVLCVNALHHIRDQARFFGECRRVLRAGGGFVTIGLDPHTATDEWWLYDYFPEALVRDRERYTAAWSIRDHLTAVGFSNPETEVAEHIAGTTPFAVADSRGSFDRRSTSQLMVISDEHYQIGLSRMTAERPVLRTDLRLFATTAWTPTVSDVERA